MFYIIQSNESKGFFGTNEMQNLIELKEKTISPDSLIIVDGRIYRGQIAFAFWDRHYLESGLFYPVIQEISNYNGQSSNLDVFFIECAIDDCGWGIITSQPDFNKSSEEIVSLFEKTGDLFAEIKNTKHQTHFKIYRTKLQLNPVILPVSDSTHEWLYYPLAYKPSNKIFDNYETHNIFDRLLNKLAYFILILDVIFSLFLLIIIILFFIKNK
jgi:hypothetical protein